jgi:hypothetical protein
MGGVTAVAAVALAAVSPSAPATVAVVGTGAKRALVRVDPRTLEPLRGFARVRVPWDALYALSPDSTRAAISTSAGVDIVDTATGRVVKSVANQGFGADLGLY